MDVLSEVLKIVTLDGAIFYNAEFSAPWQFQSPPSRDLAPYLSPAGGHVIIFHLVTEGRGAASLEGGERVPLEAGDIVVFPHGDPHVMHNGPSRKTPTSDKELHRILSQGLKVARQGGGGEVTRFVCGYMSCEPRMSQLVLGDCRPCSR